MEYEFGNLSKKHGVKEEVIVNIIESKPGTKVGYIEKIWINEHGLV
jgi:glyoxylate utilization-related uncharacterized protein